VGIPKLRQGSFFPSILERRRRIDRALFAVVMEAYVHGVSTRSVDDLVKALGAASGISKSEVSRICAELDDDLEAFRTRPLEGAFPYVFADATYVKARVRGRVISRAVVIATGVRADGAREVLGLAVGDSEDGAFWAEFFRSLRSRGLTGVKLVEQQLDQAAVEVGEGHLVTALQLYKEVLSESPRQSTALAEGGWLEWESGKAAANASLIAKGRASVTEAARVAPKFYAGHLYLGTIDLDQGQDSAAVAQYKLFLSDHPQAKWIKDYSPEIRKAYAGAGQPLPPTVPAK